MPANLCLVRVKNAGQYEFLAIGYMNCFFVLFVFSFTLENTKQCILYSIKRYIILCAYTCLPAAQPMKSMIDGLLK